MSGIINKAKAALADVTHKDNTTTKTTHTTTTSHSTVPATGTTGTTGTHVGGSHIGTTGHSTGTGIGGTSHAATTAGPHSSDMANKLDPRVDSDLSGGSHAGLNQTTHHQTGNPQTFGSGVTGSHGSTNVGPHGSNLGNAADPRVDSDLSRSHQTGGIGSHGVTHSTGITGTHGAGTHTAGTTTHSGVIGSTQPKPTLGQKLNPKIDADGDGKAGVMD